MLNIMASYLRQYQEQYHDITISTVYFHQITCSLITCFQISNNQYKLPNNCLIGF